MPSECRGRFVIVVEVARDPPKMKKKEREKIKRESPQAVDGRRSTDRLTAVRVRISNHSETSLIGSDDGDDEQAPAA